MSDQHPFLPVIPYTNDEGLRDVRAVCAEPARPRRRRRSLWLIILAFVLGLLGGLELHAVLDLLLADRIAPAAMNAPLTLTCRICGQTFIDAYDEFNTHVAAHEAVASDDEPILPLTYNDRRFLRAGKIKADN